MPSSMVKSFAEKTGKSIPQVEAKWEDAKEAAKKEYKETDKNFYAIVTSIFKKMLKINEEAEAVNTTITAGEDAIYKKKLNVPVFKRIDDKIKKKQYNEGTLLDKIDMIAEGYESDYITESKESRELQRKMNLVHLSHNKFVDKQGNSYTYNPQSKRMEKSTEEFEKKHNQKQVQMKTKNWLKSKSEEKKEKDINIEELSPKQLSNQIFSYLSEPNLTKWNDKIQELSRRISKLDDKSKLQRIAKVISNKNLDKLKQKNDIIDILSEF